jgi:hypothetical protein
MADYQNNPVYAQWERKHNSDDRSESPWARKIIVSLGEYYARSHVQTHHVTMLLIAANARRRWRRCQRLFIVTHLGGFDVQNQRHRDVGKEAKPQEQCNMLLVKLHGRRPGDEISHASLRGLFLRD